MNIYEEQQTKAWNRELSALLVKYPLLTWEEVEGWRDIKNAIFEEGGTCPRTTLLDCPVFVGEVALFAPTIAAQHLLEQTEKNWPNYNHMWKTLVRGYILHISRDIDRLKAFKNMCQEDKFEIVQDWADGLIFTTHELAEAINIVLFGDLPFYPVHKGDNHTPPVKNIAFLSSLCEKYGKDFDYWYWEVSNQMIHWLGRENASEAGKVGDDMNPEKAKMLVVERDFLELLEQKYNG